ncbi:MAG: hypothetical protein OEV40_06905 [Acidimicrobiia bacterium]|nr:hypothetical protein [Acidimicrobiia bacterium]
MAAALLTLLAGFTPLQRASLALLAWAVGLVGVFAAVLTFANLVAAGA